MADKLLWIVAETNLQTEGVDATAFSISSIDLRDEKL